MLFQKHYQSEEAHLPPEQTPVWVVLPIRVQLCLQSRSTILSSTEALLSHPFTPQEIHAIKTRSLDEHLPIETALIEYIKVAMYEHEKMKDIIRQADQEYPKKRVILDVKLLGRILWNKELTKKEEIMFNSTFK